MFPGSLMCSTCSRVSHSLRTGLSLMSLLVARLDAGEEEEEEEEDDDDEEDACGTSHAGGVAAIELAGSSNLVLFLELTY